MADLDGDGKPDLVVADSDGFISLFHNSCTPGNITASTFGPRVDLPAQSGSRDVVVGDLDGDGKPELITSAYLPQTMSVYRNQATPGSLTTNSFAAEVDFPLAGRGHDAALSDLNGDGQPDIAEVTELNSALSVFQNIGTGIFTNVSLAARVDFPAGWNAWGVVVGDLDGDGRPDVVFGNVYDNTLTIYKNLAPIAGPMPPVITAQTPNQIALLGTPATFSVTAAGSAPLSYLWLRNGALISGATNTTYVIPAVQLTDSGSKFSCLVSNSVGVALSSNMVLKVLDTISNDLITGAVVITNSTYTNTQSTSMASSYGDPVPDCVYGFGNGVWYQFTSPVNGELIVDTFGSDFDTGLAAYTASNTGPLTEVACNDDTAGVTSQIIFLTTAGTTYYFLAGGYDGSAGNLVFHLNYLTPPALVTQPTNISVVITSNALFAATLSGAQPMSFQWYFNNNPLLDDGRIVGSTNSTLNIGAITLNDGGNYQLVASNFLGVSTSSVALLTVLVPPSISMSPVGRSVPPGLPTTFTALGTGIPAPTFQWQLNGTNIPGATGTSYTAPAVGPNDLGYYTFVASNSVGVAISTAAQLTYGPVAAWGRNLSNESLPPPGLSNVVAVAGTSGAGFAVRADGSIVPWGGVGSPNVTNYPPSATNVIALATSATGACAALRSDGSVVGWNGPTLPTLTNIVSVAVGGNLFGMALRAEGTVVGWGATPYSIVPAGLNHVTAIACGYAHSLALRNDGTVVAWGTGAGTNVPAGLSGVSAIAAGYTHSLAITTNGAVIAWGSGTGTNLPAGLTNVVAVYASAQAFSGGLNFSFAIRANGTLVAWGDSPNGETNPPAALNNLFSVSGTAAPFHGLALVNVGNPQILQPPVGLTAYQGRNVTLSAAAVGAAPLAYQWLLNGTNLPGATGSSLVLPNIQFANAGNYQLLVSNAVSTVICLPALVNVISNSTLTILTQNAASPTNLYQGGKFTIGGLTVLGNGPLSYQWFFSPTNFNYQPVSGATNDTLTKDPALALNTGNYYLAVSNSVSGITTAPLNVRVLFARAWGYNAVSNPPVNVTNAIAIATSGQLQSPYGDYYALGSDGKLTAWANFNSGYGETNVSALSNSLVTAIAAGYEDALALKSDGTVYAWGLGSYGETNVPSGLAGVTAIACGTYHDLALTSFGTVVGWGAASPYNYGQTTNNPAVTNVVAIAAGTYSSLALRADGTVVSWGYTSDLTTIPPTATNIIAIAAGSEFNFALRANGTVVQWGNGLLNYPAPLNLSNIVAISASGTHCVALKNNGTVVTWGSQTLGLAANNIPTDLTNVVALASGGDHDLALFGTRAPAFTVQPWDRSVPINTVTSVTNITLAAKCSGVQPVYYQWQLNGTNVPGATNDTLALGGRGVTGAPIPIPTGAYQLVASNSYGVAASQYAKISTFIPLGVAVNATNLVWTTSGDALWYGQTNYTHDGVSAARSGGIGGSQETILQTTLATNLPGTVSFWWKVSSEQFFDTLEFRINGTVQAVISGEVDWTLASFPVAAGTNVLMWRYSKDPTFDAGLDAGFMDQFAFVSAPVIKVQPASVVANLGQTVSLSVSAAGIPQVSYQWSQNGNPIGGNTPVLTLSSVSPAQDGIYAVTVSNSGGVAVSSNAVVVVHAPQILGQPTLLSNGTLQLTSADALGDPLQDSDLANFEAQASTDLVNWVTLTNALSLTNGTLQLNDPASTNYSTRFYRIIQY